MILRYLHIQIIILVSLSLAGQQTNQHMTYQRMEGSSDQTEMKANLVRQIDQISGNYEVTNPDDTITYDLNGKIDKNNRTTLSPYGAETPSLDGVLVDHKFTGIWHDGTSTENVALTELYPPGSIPLEVYYLHSDENLLAHNPESPSAEIELMMLYPVSTPQMAPAITKNIQQIIASNYTDKIGLVDPDSVLVAAEQDFYNLYKEMDTTNWQDMEPSFSWTQENNMSVIYNSDGILSLEYLNYVYTGGAHGLTHMQHDIIDLNTGKRLVFDQIFNENVQQHLSDLLTAQLRHDRSIPDSISLKDAGYFVEKIEPTDNIYINGSGIGFTYNSYEIAPYSMGLPQIFLNYKLIKDLLRKDTPVSVLAGFLHK